MFGSPGNVKLGSGKSKLKLITKLGKFKLGSDGRDILGSPGNVSEGKQLILYQCY